MAFWGKTTQDRFKKSPNSHERSIRKRLTEGSRVSLLSSSTSLRKLNDNESMHSHYDSVDRKMSRRESSSSSSSEVFDIDDEISRAEKDIALKRKKLADARSRKEKFQLESNLALAVGALTGSFFSATITHPMDTIKTCMQGDIQQKKYTNIRNSYSMLLEEYGKPGLFKGLAWHITLITTTFFLVNKIKQGLAPVMFPFLLEDEGNSKK